MYNLIGKVLAVYVFIFAVFFAILFIPVYLVLKAV
jgi:hypothetical protein